MASASSVISNINKAIGGAPGSPSRSSTPFLPSPLKPVPAATPAPATDFNAMYASLLAQLKASQPAPPPTALNYNWAGQNARARSMAESAVNPLYQQKLNDFLAAEQVKTSRANEDATTANTNLDTALKNALDASGISRTRTTQDTTTKLANIASNEGAFQNQDAASFDANRNNLMGNVAASGLTGSGLGAQQITNATNQRNYNSGLKQQDFNNQTTQTNLASSRTFEDLARSDTLAQQGTTQQKSQVTVDLNRALQDIGTETTAQRNALESQRLADVLAQEGAYQKQLGQQWLQSLQGKVSAGTYTATAQSLAGMF